jgi:uncharacterized membrane protein
MNPAEQKVSAFRKKMVIFGVLALAVTVFVFITSDGSFSSVLLCFEGLAATLLTLILWLTAPRLRARIDRKTAARGGRVPPARR